MNTERLPSLAEANPDLHRAVGESLCNVARTINTHIGPVETARMLFALWLSFTAQYQAPEDTADYLAKVVGALRAGEPYPRAN
jgi:hypothetical protein